MKLSEFRTQVDKNKKKRVNTVKKEYLQKKQIISEQSKQINFESNIYNKSSNLKELINNESKEEQKFDLGKVKIIGVTGSKGKSSVCYLVHKYLMLKGKKSILYSSIEVDSKASIKNKMPLEVALSSSNTICEILDEVEYYGADYVIVEVNESAIEQGFVKNVPFTVRALTNIIPDCNLEQYDEKDYVHLKEAFFKDVDNSDNCKCVIGLTGYFDRLKFNNFLNLNDFEKITYASKSKCKAKNADYTNLDLLYYDESDSINGTSFNLRVKNRVYHLNSNLLLPHSIDNIICALGVIEALGEFDEDIVQKLLSNITIPGREEIIKVNGRYIIIGVFLVPMLSMLKKYKIQDKLNRIKVVCGMPGVGFKTWKNHLNSERRIKLLDYIYRDAMICVKKNADYVYLTSNDPAASNPMEICTKLQNHINNEIPSKILIDRKKAIRQAIVESNVNDVIYIAGRGNRRLFCKSYDKMDIYTDKEVVMDVLKELGW